MALISLNKIDLFLELGYPGNKVNDISIRLIKNVIANEADGYVQIVLLRDHSIKLDYTQVEDSSTPGQPYSSVEALRLRILSLINASELNNFIFMDNNDFIFMDGNNLIFIN